MSGFTKGPWKIAEYHQPVRVDACRTPTPCFEVMAPGDACWIAQVQNHRNCISTAEGDANARLIAAAPRMYEALKIKLKWCREHGDCADAALMGDEYCSDECVAMAAVITEIEGKSNAKV